jgi:hypothetical protein
VSRTIRKLPADFPAGTPLAGQSVSPRPAEEDVNWDSIAPFFISRVQFWPCKPLHERYNAANPELKKEIAVEMYTGFSAEA